MKYATHVALCVTVFGACARFMLSADAGDLREFVLCEHATGKEHGPMIQDGVKTTGVFRTKPEVVARLIEIHGNKCTVIVNNNGAHVSVVGSAAEVECRLLGGNNCAARKSEK